MIPASCRRALAAGGIGPAADRLRVVIEGGPGLGRESLVRRLAAVDYQLGNWTRRGAGSMLRAGLVMRLGAGGWAPDNLIWTVCVVGQRRIMALNRVASPWDRAEGLWRAGAVR